MFAGEEIEKIISEKILGLTGKKIMSQTEELVDSGILTSITMAELAVELENFFSISFSFMDVNRENFLSAAAIKNLVQRRS